MRANLLSSSVFLGALGLACLFVPAETTSALGLPAGAATSLPLAAPALLGIAAMNAAGRGALYGGIYGRPIVLANFLTAGIGTLVLLSLQLESLSVFGAVLGTLFATLWGTFARLLFRPPFEDPSPQPR